MVRYPLCGDRFNEGAYLNDHSLILPYFIQKAFLRNRFGDFVPVRSAQYSAAEKPAFKDVFNCNRNGFPALDYGCAVLLQQLPNLWIRYPVPTSLAICRTAYRTKVGKGKSFYSDTRNLLLRVIPKALEHVDLLLARYLPVLNLLTDYVGGIRRKALEIAVAFSK